MLIDKKIRHLLTIAVMTIPLISIMPRNAIASEPLKISNNSGKDVLYLYISSSDNRGWGPDLLQENVLRYNRDINFFRPNNYTCDYDIRVVLSDGQDMISDNVDLCKNRDTSVDVDINPDGITIK